MAEVNSDILHKIEYRLNRDGYFVYHKIIREFKLNGSFKNSVAFKAFVKAKKIVRVGQFIWATPATAKKIRKGEIKISIRKNRDSALKDLEIERKILTLHREFTPTTVLRLITGCRIEDVNPVVDRMVKLGVLSIVPQREYYKKPRTFKTPFYFVTAYDSEMVGGIALRHSGSKIDNVRFALLQFRKKDERFNVADLTAKLDEFPAFGYAELKRLINAGYLSHDKKTGYYEFIK